MDIKRLSVPGEGVAVPAILITPAHPRGAAIIMHGYGGKRKSSWDWDLSQQRQDLQPVLLISAGTENTLSRWMRQSGQTSMQFSISAVSSGK